MKKLYYLLLGAGLVAGCHSPAPDSATTTVAPADSAAPPALTAAAAVAWQPPPLPPDTVPGAAGRAVLHQAAPPPADTSAPLLPRPGPPPRRWAPLGAGQPGNHRYVGTLGGQPVVVELSGQLATASEPGYFSGSYYFEWGGQAHGLAPLANRRPDQPLLLLEQPDEYAGDTVAIWRAAQRLGPVLTGTWTDRRTRRTARFALRESYAGAVRYELLPEKLRARDSCRENGHYRRGYVQVTWLHLLGKAARRPALRRLQCPPPSRRRQQLRAELPEPTASCEEGVTYGIFRSASINYNGNNLLSYTLGSAEDMGGPYPSNDVEEEHLVDLTTGRECQPEDWLLPARLPQFRQLFTTYLLHDEYGRRCVPAFDVPGLKKAPYGLQELPPLRLTSQGLAFRLGEIGAPHVTASVTITVPYTQLAPYVRPGTPLARLVALRTRARP